MNEKNLILLLKTIQSKGNMKRLRREDLTFRQIITLTEEAVNLEFLTYEDNKIILTELGHKYLTENIDHLKNINKDEWIEPDYKNKIKCFPKNEVFLPDRSEFSFFDEGSH